MKLNCDEIVEKYLLIQNPLYAFSFPISVLVAIIMFGVAKAYKWSNNSYINQIVIPLISLMLTVVLLNFIAKMMISNEDREALLNLCNKWMDDSKSPINSVDSIDMNVVANYKIEDFNTIDEDSQIKQHIDEDHPIGNIETPHINRESDIKAAMRISGPLDVQYATIPTLHPSPLNSAPNGNMCIENSNGCNLCSGSGENPYDIIAPVPGPQWMPQSADSMQTNLMNNRFTESKCPI